MSPEERLHEQDEFQKIAHSIFAGLTGCFVFIILGIFPLYYRDYYFDMLEAKYKFYYIATISYIALMVLAATVLITIDGLEFKLKYTKIILRKMSAKWLKNLDLTDAFMLAFLLVSIISTLQSDFIYEAFWGNEGRYSGLFLIILYALSFLAISIFFRYKRSYINLFLAAGMLVCIFGITDYFQMDLLKFKKEMTDPEELKIFVSTIGNINTYTAYVAMIMGASTVLFAKAERRLHMVCYYLCMVISFFAIIMGISDNSYLSLGALFLFLPLYLFETRAGFRRYLVIAATFFSVLYATVLINRWLPEQVITMDGILKIAAEFRYLLHVVIVMWGVCFLVYSTYKLKKAPDKLWSKKWKSIWIFFLILSLFALLFVLYDSNIAGNEARYGALRNYLYFDDNWGTHRGFNWKLAWENYKEFSISHKIWGFGPDTYGIVTHYNSFDEMVNRFFEIYDNAHNEYLQYFITIGPLGLLAYIGVLVGTVYNIMKKQSGDPWIVAIAFSIICYATQAIVNVNVVICTAVFFTLLAIGTAGSKRGAAKMK